MVVVRFAVDLDPGYLAASDELDFLAVVYPGLVNLYFVAPNGPTNVSSERAVATNNFAALLDE